MSRKLPIDPLDPNGFWAFVWPEGAKSEYGYGGYVTATYVGPFQFLRVDYVSGSVRGPWGTFRDALLEQRGESWAVLYPPHALPLVMPATEEDIYKDLADEAKANR